MHAMEIFVVQEARPRGAVTRRAVIQRHRMAWVLGAVALGVSLQGLSLPTEANAQVPVEEREPVVISVTPNDSATVEVNGERVTVSAPDIQVSEDENDNVQVNVQVDVHIEGAQALTPPAPPPAPQVTAPVPPPPPAPRLIPQLTPPQIVTPPTRRAPRIINPMDRYRPNRLGEAPRRAYGGALTLMFAGFTASLITQSLIWDCWDCEADPWRALAVVSAGAALGGAIWLIRRIVKYRRARREYNQARRGVISGNSGLGFSF